MIFARGGKMRVQCDGDDDGERCTVVHTIEATGVTESELRAIVAATGIVDEHGYHYCPKHKTPDAA